MKRITCSIGFAVYFLFAHVFSSHLYAEEHPGLSDQERSTISLFEKESPSVVYINSIAVQRDVFNFNVFEIPQGTGSGFIWDTAGHVVTNFHVIKDADVAEVTLSDGSKYKARLVGYELDKDLAVLRINAPATKLRPIQRGRSYDLRVGQSVLAIGNPFGFDLTLTTGIVSGLGREITAISGRPIQGVIQTDAAINPGNSGGPLLDSAGSLIGINTAIYSSTGASSGIGFAVPVDVVNRMVPQIIQFGRVKKPGLGIRMGEDQIAERLGLTGVLIVGISPNGPAARAGLRATEYNRYGQILLGDLIIGVRDRPVEDSNDLFRILDGCSIGEEIELNILREGERKKIQLRLDDVG